MTQILYLLALSYLLEREMVVWISHKFWESFQLS